MEITRSSGPHLEKYTQFKPTCCSAGGCSDSSAQCAHVVHNDNIYPSNHLLCNPGPSGHHCHSCSSIQFLEAGRVQDTHEHLLDHEGPALMERELQISIRPDYISMKVLMENPAYFNWQTEHHSWSCLKRVSNEPTLLANSTIRRFPSKSLPFK